MTRQQPAGGQGAAPPPLAHSDASLGRTPAAPARGPRKPAAAKLLFRSEQGDVWRVVDLERKGSQRRYVPLGSVRATHRGFVLVGGYPQAVQYAFRPTDGPDAHEFAPTRLQSQLYLGERVKIRGQR